MPLRENIEIKQTEGERLANDAQALMERILLQMEAAGLEPNEAAYMTLREAASAAQIVYTLLLSLL